MTEYLTRRELSAMLKLSPSTLESPRFRRSGPSYTRIGGVVRYAMTDILMWLDRQRVPQ